MHPVSFSTRVNNAGAPHVSEVAADFRLIGVQNLYKKADADLIATHQVQQSQACSIRQSFEEHPLVDRFRSHGYDPRMIAQK
jgi:hypothetical protein